MTDARTVAVVGAGAVGASVALRLVLAGHKVTLFDPDPGGEGAASFGNAGHIGAASVVPWANPANRRIALAARRDPLHPLVLTNRQMLLNARWVGRWLRASTAARAEAGGRHLAALLSSVFDDLDPLLEAADARALLRRDGLLHLFASDAAFRAAEAGFAQRRALGVPVTTLTQAEIFDLEPAFARSNAALRPARGVLLPSVGQVLDPSGLVRRYLAAIEARGGAVRMARVKSFASRADGIAVVTEDGEATAFDNAVLAAGVASGPLARSFGARVPLIAERGYHRQFHVGADLLTRSALFVDSRVVFSPMAGGVRLTTGVEFTRPGTPAVPDRMTQIFEAARALLPSLPPLPEARAWTGDRPSTPDSLPVIGPAPRDPRLVFAYGHGHSGLTLAAPTARLVEDVIGAIGGGALRRKLAPYAPDRAG